MGYEVVKPATVNPLADRDCETFPICGSSSDTDMFETLGIRLYVADPGNQIPPHYHYHETQEEAFYVIEGTLNVETPGTVYEIDEGCLFLVEPGSPHRAFNPTDADSQIRVLAMGAPTQDSGQLYESSATDH